MSVDEHIDAATNLLRSHQGGPLVAQALDELERGLFCICRQNRARGIGDTGYSIPRHPILRLLSLTRYYAIRFLGAIWL